MNEVLTYFPEHAPIFDRLRVKLDEFISTNERELESVVNTNYATRKELAKYVTKTICPGCVFSVLDGKSPSAKDFVMNMPVDSLERYLSRV
jgi:hypothetical protein